MPWTPLQSTNLEAFDYDAEMRVLHIRFKGGRPYSYADVPPNVVEEFAAADSAGKFFAENIKERFRPFW